MADDDAKNAAAQHRSLFETPPSDLVDTSSRSLRGGWTHGDEPGCRMLGSGHAPAASTPCLAGTCLLLNAIAAAANLDACDCHQVACINGQTILILRITVKHCSVLRSCRAVYRAFTTGNNLGYFSWTPDRSPMVLRLSSCGCRIVCCGKSMPYVVLYAVS
jgi:hypothetical protein